MLLRLYRFLLMVSLTAAAIPIHASDFHIDDEHLLFFELKLDRFTLEEALIAYRHGNDILLPLAEICQALSFPISADDEPDVFKGWFLNERRTFFLDLKAGEVILSGVPGRLDPQQVLHLPDGVFVASRQLSEWFPIEFAINQATLQISVISKEPLPLEQKLLRERRHKKVGFRRSQIPPDYPLITNPYRPVDWPFLDLKLRTGWSERQGATPAFDLAGTGDMAWLTSNLFVSGASRNGSFEVTNARLNLGRSDPDGSLFGPLKAARFQIGDITTAGRRPVAGSKTGGGFIVSNHPLERPDNFDLIDIDGNGYPGWDVELYKNGVLVNFGDVDTSGRYLFRDVPLTYGINHFRLVFHGPEGQEKEEIRQYRVDGGLTRPGEWLYRAAHQQMDQGFLTEVASGAPTGSRSFIELARGLTERLSLNAMISQYEEEHHKGYNGLFGLRSSFPKAIANLEFASDEQGGWYGLGSLQADVLGLQIFTEYSQYDGFTSSMIEENESAPARRLVFRSSRRFAPAGLNLNLSLRQVDYRAGGSDLVVSQSIAASLKGIALTHVTSYQDETGPDLERNTRLTGTFLANGRLGKLRLRGGLTWRAMPEGSIERMNVSLSRSFRHNLRTTFNAEHRLAPTEQDRFSLSVQTVLKRVSLGLTAGYNSVDGSSLNLTLSTGLGRNPRSGGWSSQSNGLARRSGLATRVFLDLNGNQIYDPQEPLLPGVKFIINRRSKEMATNEHGQAFFTGLRPNRLHFVTLDLSSMSDPYLISRKKGYTFLTRPGQVTRVDFPLVTTGEIEGTVRVNGREAANVSLELVDGEGTVVFRERTGFDGFYLFSMVPLGEYHLRISPDQVRDLAFESLTPIKIQLKESGQVVLGQDLELMKKD